jgi:hypothetical protein
VPGLPIGTLVIGHDDLDPVEIPISRAVFDQGILVLTATAPPGIALGPWRGDVTVLGCDGRQVYHSNATIDRGSKSAGDSTWTHTVTVSLRSVFPGRSLDEERFRLDEAARRRRAGYPEETLPLSP